MKIEQIKHLEIETSGDVDTVKASIAADSMPFLFEMMSKSLYSDPIGSVVREITSNCFDAHKEAGIEEPVLIKKSFDRENDQYYIHFIDVGVGLSPERVKTIYMKWFSSTKRDTNDQIGGFGLGSKTPLAYQDMFYINTRHEGIEYNYVLSKGEREPQLDLIGEEPTTERNGTEIKIAIKDSKVSYTQSEVDKFTSAIKSQLCYFDNVYVVGFPIDNEYKIFEGTYFKYRNKNQYSGFMHVVLGKVAYPIDWKAIGYDEPIDIPVAVKFEIGELVVTPNREQLRYTEEIKAIVQERIKLCLAELKAKYESQNPEIGDIFKYLNLKDTKPMVSFDENNKLYIPVKYGVKNNIAYTPLKHLDITIPDNPFKMFSVFMKVSGGKNKMDDWDILRTLKISLNSLYFNKFKTSNEVKNAYIDNATVLTSCKIDYSDWCTYFGLYEYKTDVYSRDYNERYDYKKDENGKKRRRVPVLGKAKIIKEAIDHFRSLVLSKCTDYQALEVPGEFIKEYRERRKAESTAYQRKLQGKVLVRNIYGSKREESLKYLSEIPILIYGHNEREVISRLKDVEEFINIRISTTKKVVQCIVLSNEVFKKVAKLENAIHVDNIWEHPKLERMIRDYATAQEIKKIVHPLTRFRYMIERLRQDMYNRFNQLEKFCNKYPSSIDAYNKVLEIAERKGLVNLEKMYEANILKKYFENFEIVEYLQNNIPNRLLLQICKPFKKRLNSEFYLKPKPKAIVEPEPEIEVENTPSDNEPTALGSVTIRPITLPPNNTTINSTSTSQILSYLNVPTTLISYGSNISIVVPNPVPDTDESDEIDMDEIDRAIEELLPQNNPVSDELDIF